MQKKKEMGLKGTTNSLDDEYLSPFCRYRSTILDPSLPRPQIAPKGGEKLSISLEREVREATGIVLCFSSPRLGTKRG